MPFDELFEEEQPPVVLPPPPRVTTSAHLEAAMSALEMVSLLGKLD